jgi:hypothetical protein
VRKTVMQWGWRVGGGGAYADAQRRKPEDWRTHFVDRFGGARPPPFDQPTDPVWKRQFDCAKLETQDDIWALQNEYQEQFPATQW